MPNAFFKAGLVIGFVGTILIGSLCTYCIHVLVSSVSDKYREFYIQCSGEAELWITGWTDLTVGFSGGARMTAEE